MVFSGRASLSCKNCRTRRIKCNKQEPECSQCIRAGKKCPGYRDQLSLLFRDETVKVCKKFEVVTDDSGGNTLDREASETLAPDDTTEHSQSSPSDISTEPAVSVPSPGVNLATAMLSLNKSEGQNRRDETSTALSPKSLQRLGEVPVALTDHFIVTAKGSNAKSNKDIRPKKQRQRRSKVASSVALSGVHKGGNIRTVAQMATVQTIIRGPGQTPVEQGLHFYLEYYLYGHPESPPKSSDVAVHIPWILDPSARLIASAVGLASLGNLNGDVQTKITSWQNYLTGLQMTAQILQTPDLVTLNTAIRCVVLMAMFDIARGVNKYANVHAMGAAALLYHFLPVLPKRHHPFRGLLQLCFSLLIPCIGSKSRVPPVIINYVTSIYKEVPKDDQIMTELLLLLCELTDLLAYIDSQLLTDKRTDVVDIVVQTLHLESRLLAWERNVSGEGIWKYEECEIASLLPQACFKGRFYRYSDTSVARLWSYYRWAQILVNQLILELIGTCPLSVMAALVRLGDASSSSASGITEASHDPIERLRGEALRIIRKCADDTFASAPSNWRHPSTPLATYAQIATKPPVYGANGGPGAMTLVPTLYHLQTAACAPGVPHEDWKWALGVIDTMWAYLGLQLARTLADQMRAHYDSQLRRASV